MNKPQLKKPAKQNKKAPLPPSKRRSTGKSSIPVVPKGSPLLAREESQETEQVATPAEIQVISPIYFKNHRGEVFEQARDGAVFVIKRHSEHMAIICGYSAETLAKVTGLDKQDTELDEDPMQQRVSITELLELIKMR